MTLHPTPGPDDFPAGLLVTDADGRILYANDFLAERFGYRRSTLCEQNFTDLLSVGSRIMYQAYLLPMVLHDGHCEEIHIALLNGDGEKSPVTVNARMSEGGKWIYWGIFSSVQRDRLDQELIEARRLLEQRAEELHRLSITDDLTGLLNRRELKSRAQQVLASSERSACPVSLLVLDIDHFKQINDEHGHSAGDRVLEKMGELFRRQGRTSDLMARMGGEEFVFLLPDTDVEEARAFARRLHAAISEIRIANTGVTVSIGIATDRSQRDFDALFQKADQAMYQAKDAGRNCTRVLELA